MPPKKNVKTEKKPKKQEWLCETCEHHWQATTGEGREINACLKNLKFDMNNNDIVVSCKGYKYAG